MQQNSDLINFLSINSIFKEQFYLFFIDIYLVIVLVAVFHKTFHTIQNTHSYSITSITLIKKYLYTLKEKNTIIFGVIYY